MPSLNDIVPAGVVTGDNLLTLLTHAKEHGYAIPAVNCTRYDTSSTTSRFLGFVFGFWWLPSGCF